MTGCEAKLIEGASNHQKPIKYRVYSRPRSRAIAVVSRCTGFGPPTLFDRGRVWGRKGVSWMPSTGVAGGIGEFSNETIGDLNVITTGGLLRGMRSAMVRIGDGGGIVGSGFEAG